MFLVAESLQIQDNMGCALCALHNIMVSGSKSDQCPWPVGLSEIIALIMMIICSVVSVLHALLPRSIKVVRMLSGASADRKVAWIG